MFKRFSVWLALAGIGQITNVDGFVGPSRLEVWDWQTGKRAASLQDSHQAVLNDVLWSSDGRKLTAAGGGDGRNGDEGRAGACGGDDRFPQQKPHLGQVGNQAGGDPQAGRAAPAAGSNPRE